MVVRAYNRGGGRSSYPGEGAFKVSFIYLSTALRATSLALSTLIAQNCIWTGNIVKSLQSLLPLHPRDQPFLLFRITI